MRPRSRTIRPAFRRPGARRRRPLFTAAWATRPRARTAFWKPGIMSSICSRLAVLSRARRRAGASAPAIGLIGIPGRCSSPDFHHGAARGGRLGEHRRLMVDSTANSGINRGETRQGRRPPPRGAEVIWTRSPAPFFMVGLVVCGDGVVRSGTNHVRPPPKLLTGAAGPRLSAAARPLAESLSPPSNARGPAPVLKYALGLASRPKRAYVRPGRDARRYGRSAQLASSCRSGDEALNLPSPGAAAN